MSAPQPIAIGWTQRFAEGDRFVRFISAAELRNPHGQHRSERQDVVGERQPHVNGSDL